MLGHMALMLSRNDNPPVRTLGQMISGFISMIADMSVKVIFIITVLVGIYVRFGMRLGQLL